jgi:hypothetical protein
VIVWVERRMTVGETLCRSISSRAGGLISSSLGRGVSASGCPGCGRQSEDRGRAKREHNESAGQRHRIELPASRLCCSPSFDCAAASGPATAPGSTPGPEEDDHCGQAILQELS